MTVELTPHEARVIGCLMEKQVATPDQYPLSLNALTNACNQKSNRHPVLELAERDVQAVVDGLMRKQLVLEKSGFGSRVPKYHQLFCNTQFGSLKFSPLQTAIVCELLLRGPQTPGELRTHAARLAPVKDVGEIEEAVEELMTRPAGPYIVKLAREPGRRESRYAQLFTGPITEGLAGPDDDTDITAAGFLRPAAGRLDEAALARIAALEATVAELRQEIDGLKARLSEDPTA
jgi:uncharacterized protein YceH (UPF0502 family)